VSFVTGGPPVADLSPRTAVVRGCWGMVGWDEGCVGGGCVEDAEVDASAACAVSVDSVGSIEGMSGAEKDDAVGSRGVCTVGDTLLSGTTSEVEMSTATSGERESALAGAEARGANLDAANPFDS